MDDLILIFCVRDASGWLELTHAGVLGELSRKLLFL